MLEIFRIAANYTIDSTSEGENQKGQLSGIAVVLKHETTLVGMRLSCMARAAEAALPLLLLSTRPRYYSSMYTVALYAGLGRQLSSTTRWIGKAIELNRHTTCMKIRGSVVSLSFIFPNPIRRRLICTPIFTSFISESLLLSSFWTSRGHRFRPFPPPRVRAFIVIVQGVHSAFPTLVDFSSIFFHYQVPGIPGRPPSIARVGLYLARTRT